MYDFGISVTKRTVSLRSKLLQAVPREFVEKTGPRAKKGMNELSVIERCP